MPITKHCWPSASPSTTTIHYVHCRGRVWLVIESKKGLVKLLPNHQALRKKHWHDGQHSKKFLLPLSPYDILLVSNTNAGDQRYFLLPADNVPFEWLAGEVNNEVPPDWSLPQGFARTYSVDAKTLHLSTTVRKIEDLLNRIEYSQRPISAELAALIQKEEITVLATLPEKTKVYMEGRAGYKDEAEEEDENEGQDQDQDQKKKTKIAKEDRKSFIDYRLYYLRFAVEYMRLVDLCAMEKQFIVYDIGQHPAGCYIFMYFRWSDEDCQQWFEYRRLPMEIWEHNAATPILYLNGLDIKWYTMQPKIRCSSILHSIWGKANLIYIGHGVPMTQASAFDGYGRYLLPSPLLKNARLEAEAPEISTNGHIRSSYRIHPLSNGLFVDNYSVEAQHIVSELGRLLMAAEEVIPWGSIDQIRPDDYVYTLQQHAQWTTLLNVDRYAWFHWGPARTNLDRIDEMEDMEDTMEITAEEY